MITPGGHIITENKDDSLVRVTGVVWNLIPQYVCIRVDDNLIHTQIESHTDGHSEVTGDFATTDNKGEIIRIELVYKRDIEYRVLSTVHFTVGAF